MRLARRFFLFVLTLAAVAPASALTVAVNDPAVLSGLSPYNWQRNGSTSIKTVNAGAYLRVRFTGTSIGLTVDVSALVAQSYAAGVYPVLKYIVDGTIIGTRQLTSSDTSFTLVSGLSDTTHLLYLEVIGMDGGNITDRWTGPHGAVVITGLVVDTARALVGATPRTGGYYLAMGDSITEGAVTIAAKSGGNSYAQIMDSSRGHQDMIARSLGLEYGNVAFSGGGWNEGISNYPGIVTAYAFLFNGAARTFTPAPDVATINMGTNNSVPVTSGDVSTFLTNFRAAVGARCWIHLIVPFNQTNASAVTGGHSTYTAANPTDLRITLINLSTAGANIITANNFGDGIHPNAAGQELLGLAVLPSITNPLRPGNPANALAGF